MTGGPVGGWPELPKSLIRQHYDQCSQWYARLWGEHIHHGLWQDSESPEEAQVRLIARLAEAAAIPERAAVLDAGCGLGGSALWLAEQRHCQVTAVTISPVQARHVARKARRTGLGDRVEALQADLETVDFPRDRFDVVWSIECTEHLYDKAQFLAKASAWLRPGGRIALCAWTAAEGATAAQWSSYLEPVCRGFLCPSLASAGEYVAWLQQSSLRLKECADLTEHTRRTWDICLRRTRRPWARVLALLLPRSTRRFLASFSTIRDAFRCGALRYSLIVGYKEGVPVASHAAGT